MSRNLIDFEKEYPNYEYWYANIPPSEIRKLIGRQIVYVDYVDPYRKSYFINTNIIKGAHRSFIIFENGNNIDKRDIKCAGLKLIEDEN